MRPSTMQVPLCNNFLAEVWWLLGLEERRKRLVATHSPRQHPVPSLVQFCGWQGRVGAAKSSLGGQPRLTLCGNLFCLKVMRWLHSIHFWRLVDALLLPHSPCLPSVLSCVAHGRKSPNIQSCLPQGLVPVLCQGVGAMASVPEQPLLSPCLQVHLAWSTHRWSKR